MKIVRTIVEDIKEPGNKYVYWFDFKEYKIKRWDRGGWIPVGIDESKFYTKEEMNSLIETYDANCVHKTEDEIINGIKTFNNTIIAPNSSDDTLINESSDAVVNGSAIYKYFQSHTPEIDESNLLHKTDDEYIKSGIKMFDPTNSYIGFGKTVNTLDGAIKRYRFNSAHYGLDLSAYGPSNNNTRVVIQGGSVNDGVISFEGTGGNQSTAGSRPNWQYFISGLSNDYEQIYSSSRTIPTGKAVYDYVQNAISDLPSPEPFDDSNCVHKTGDESIDGSKTFNDCITFYRSTTHNNTQATFINSEIVYKNSAIPSNLFIKAKLNYTDGWDGKYHYLQYSLNGAFNDEVPTPGILLGERSITPTDLDDVTKSEGGYYTVPGYYLVTSEYLREMYHQYIKSTLFTRIQDVRYPDTGNVLLLGDNYIITGYGVSDRSYYITESNRPHYRNTDISTVDNYIDMNTPQMHILNNSLVTITVNAGDKSTTIEPQEYCIFYKEGTKWNCVGQKFTKKI